MYLGTPHENFFLQKAKTVISSESLQIQAVQFIQSEARLKLDKEGMTIVFGVSFLSGFAENLAKSKELWSKIFAC